MARCTIWSAPPPSVRSRAMRSSNAIRRSPTAPASPASTPPSPARLTPGRQTPITVDYDSSLVGRFTEQNAISFTRDNGAWRVAWTPSLIFNGLGTDGCVDVDVQPVRRGTIFDRNGEPLAYDGTVERVGVVPEQIPASDHDRVLKALSDLTGSPVDTLEKQIDAADPTWFVQIKDFPASRGQELLNVISGLPGVSVHSATARVYPPAPKRRTSPATSRRRRPRIGGQSRSGAGATDWAIRSRSGRRRSPVGQAGGAPDRRRLRIAGGARDDRRPTGRAVERHHADDRPRLASRHRRRLAGAGQRQGARSCSIRATAPCWRWRVCRPTTRTVSSSASTRRIAPSSTAKRCGRCSTARRRRLIRPARSSR